MYMSRVAVGSFFYLHFADQPELALAHAPDDRDLEKRLLAGGEVTDWRVLHFTLGEGVQTDYLANSFAIRLCSQKLREVIDGARGRDDVVQWLPAVVIGRDGVEMPHWVLHFPEPPEVLNVSKSLMAGAFIVNACLDPNLVAGLKVFGFPNEDLRLLVAYDVRRAIERAGCTGMAFSRVPMA